MQANVYLILIMNKLDWGGYSGSKVGREKDE